MGRLPKYPLESPKAKVKTTAAASTPWERTGLAGEGETQSRRRGTRIIRRIEHTIRPVGGQRTGISASHWGDNFAFPSFSLS